MSLHQKQAHSLCVFRSSAASLVFEQETSLKEYDLLHFLILQRGTILTRQMLLTQVWGTDVDMKSRTLNVHIAQLRRKIELDPEPSPLDPHHSWHRISLYG